MKVIVITVNEKNELEMTTNMLDHQKRIDILKAAILQNLKPNSLTEKLRKHEF